MTKIFLTLSLVILSSSSYSSNLCDRSQADYKKMLTSESSRISFKNAGGMINRGVCWWHSRLQRSSVYLVEYRPLEARPSLPELAKIINSLRVMSEIVIIPGYSDFETFSRDYQDELQMMLNDWQKRDGILNFEWLRGISGRSSLPAIQMRSRMDSVYHHYLNSPTPLWIMAQIKGITSHSLLILNMKKTSTGYDLSVIDSNYPLKTISIEYHLGDKFLRAPGSSYSFVPYTGFQKDFLKIAKVIRSECGQFVDDLNLESLTLGEVE